jgi:hypothetical protein
MDNRMRDPETQGLIPDSAAAQLLKRAVEIDTRRGMSVSIADLRAAAVEAGISTAAFDDALAELRAREAQALAKPQQARQWRRLGIAGLTVTVLAAAFVVVRLLSPASVQVVEVEQSFSLQCLGTQDAIVQVRDAVGPDGTISVTRAAPHILRVRATPPRMRDVQSLLGRIDGPQSPACATRVNPPDTMLRRTVGARTLTS